MGATNNNEQPYKGFLLRHRADRDGFTLMRGNLMVAGGGLTHCLEMYFQMAPQQAALVITRDVAHHIQNAIHNTR